jgi:adenylosuccinate lyase
MDRYSTAEFQKLWSEQSKFDTMWKVELAALNALECLGIVPIETKCLGPDTIIDVSRIHQIEEETKHETIAFLSHLEERCSCSCFRWIHFGLTSSDILDTTQALLMKEATEILEKKLILVLDSLEKKCLEHSETLIMGRSHGMHAEPTTLGFVLGSHYVELKRSHQRLKRVKDVIAVGKLSGAVGNYIYFSPKAEELALMKLGLSCEAIGTQVIPRDRYAEYFSVLALVASAIERLATNIRLYQRTEVGELAEGFSSGQKGSSAMPHKRNPILCENLCGLARIVRSALVPAFEDITLWHERDMSHSSVERFILPDTTSTLGFMLERILSIIDNLFIDKERMLDNISLSKGVYASQGILLELIRAGMDRQQAYKLVQTNAFQALDKDIAFEQQLFTDEKVSSILTAEQISKCCSLKEIGRNNKIRLEELFG